MAYGFSQSIMMFAYAAVFYLGGYLIIEGKLNSEEMFRYDMSIMRYNNYYHTVYYTVSYESLTNMTTIMELFVENSLLPVAKNHFIKIFQFDPDFKQ